MREYKRQRLPFLPSRLFLFFIALWVVFDYLFAGDVRMWDDVFSCMAFRRDSGRIRGRPAGLLPYPHAIAFSFIILFVSCSQYTSPQYMYTRSDIRRALRVREKKKQAALML